MREDDTISFLEESLLDRHKKKVLEYIFKNLHNPFYVNKIIYSTSASPRVIKNYLKELIENKVVTLTNKRQEGFKPSNCILYEVNSEYIKIISEWLFAPSEI